MKNLARNQVSSCNARGKSTPIDLVIMWVDGSDPAWRLEKAKYQDNKSDAGEIRYRDWGLLRYWFRGIETCAPWFRKVHFVTWGHVPSWLDCSNPKLNVVRHDEFIPEEYLPVFSPRPIEMNLHRIPGLSENFVLFDDDMFLLKPCSEELFFKNDLPVHPAIMHAVVPLSTGKGESRAHMLINMVAMINRSFDAKKSIGMHRAKWFMPWNCGFKNAMCNLFLSRYSEFAGFANEHVPVPVKKSVIEEIWRKEGVVLEQTCHSRFRDSHDVCQFLFRYWNLASGNFEVVKPDKLGVRVTLQPGDKKPSERIKAKKDVMICINDGEGFEDRSEFESIQRSLIEAFEYVFPKPSSFEIQ